MTTAWPGRFWDKVDRSAGPDACWPWLGSLNGNGYGVTWFPKEGTKNAHRVAYRLSIGEIPAGLEVEHKCRNRACMNPAHFELLDHKANTLRGTSFVAVNARQTHCIYGHPFAGANLVIGKRQRYCRTCQRNSSRDKLARETPEQRERRQKRGRENARAKRRRSA